MCEAADNTVIHTATMDAEAVTAPPPDTFVPNTQVSPLIFEGLLELMDEYEIWDIIDIVDALHMAENKVWVNLKMMTIQQLLDSLMNKMGLAKDVVPVAWLGGPPRLVDGKPKKTLMRGSLMHYVIDVILRQTVETGSKKPIIQSAASHLSMEK